jgi:anaerobic selenocysteine-containing dehydrogenase
MAWTFPKLSRRTFLKTSGAGVAGLSLLKANASLHKDGQLRNVESEGTSYTICNFCSSLCNVKVTSRVSTIHGKQQKRVVKLDGNPNSTLNRGKLCARGQSGVRQTYDVDRFKTPLIRKEGTKRGEWAFREATWEETWKYIEKKTKGANIQPWEWTLVGGWTSCIFYMNWSVPFAVANGIPNIVASPMQHCVTTGHLGTDAVTGNFNVHDEILPDYDNAKYIIYVGNNSSIAGVSTPRAVRFAQGKKNGAKVVVLDPRLSETGSKADEWIAIRPGTDLDFCLAMLREMLDKKLYDSEFLRTHTNMPFLVYKDDKGQWHLAKDDKGQYLVVRDGTSDIHVLPAYTNSNRTDIKGAALYPALHVPENIKIPTGFEGAGQTAVTVLQAQLEEIDLCTPEWAEKTTGIPAKTILRITHEFATTRPALIDPGWHGARFGNMMMARRVQAMLQTLNGGIDKEGGWIMSGELHHKLAEQVKAKEEGRELPAPMATYAGMDFALFVVKAFSTGANFQPHGRPGWAWVYSEQQKAEGKQGVALPVLADEGLKESIEGKVKWKDGTLYLTRAMFINAANPVRHYYPDTYWKDIMANDTLELVIALDVLPSDTTPYADVILPHSTYLERSEPTLYGNGVNQDLAVTTRYAAIDPLYDSREIPDVLLKLTEIISGKEKALDNLTGMIEGLAGLPAEPVKAAWKRLKEDKGILNPFTVACRETAFAETAKKLHTTVEELDNTLREKGVYHEADWHDILEHHAMPRHLPAPTATGRLEFYSSLFDMLRAGGGNTPHFSVLAKAIPAECRQEQTMDQPLADDEFYFAYGKVPTVSYGSTNSNNPVLYAINVFKKDIYTGIWIHPDRAGKLGLKTGDKVKLKNTLSAQEADGKVYVTRQVRPDTLFVHSAFGVENPQLTNSYAMGGTATNKLIPHNVDPVVAGFRSQEFTIRVTKA